MDCWIQPYLRLINDESGEELLGLVHTPDLYKMIAIFISDGYFICPIGFARNTRRIGSQRRIITKKPRH